VAQRMDVGIYPADTTEKMYGRIIVEADLERRG
jgi:hypothetical protein